jgi:hypothetical protein
MTEHVSDLRWDRLLAGELADSDRADVLAHAEACATCAARRDEITAGFDAFARVAPALPRPAPSGIAPSRRASSRKRMLAVGGAVVAAAAAVVLLLRAPSTSTTRTKGGDGPKLMLAAGPRERLVPVASGDLVQPGDSIQAAYTTTRDGFGAVLARDGSGAAAVYVPADGQAMVALPAGTMRSFPGSTILDEVLGMQAVVIVWCETTRPVAPLVAELRETGAVTAPQGCTVGRVVLDVHGAQ